MVVDMKTSAKLNARRRGAIMLVLTCLGLPLGMLAQVVWGTLTGLCVFGAVMASVAVVWIISSAQTPPNDRGQGTK